MEWSSTQGGEVYESSVIYFNTVFHALHKVESSVICFASDFTHTYAQFGAFGNIWGFVTADPDGATFIVYFYFG